MPPRTPIRIELSDAERCELEHRSRAHCAPHREVVRALAESHPGLSVWMARGDPLRSGSALQLLSQLIQDREVIGVGNRYQVAWGMSLRPVGMVPCSSDPSPLPFAQKNPTSHASCPDRSS